MKRTFILSIALLFAIFLFGQERNYNFVPKKNQNIIDINPGAVFSKSSSAFVLDESFESAVPPTGWTKASPDGGSGWEQQTNGTSPMPGWNGGTIDVPEGGGNAVAYCTWTTGGGSSNDQWLISPQISINSGDELSFWVRKFGSYIDVMDVLVSTTSNSTSDFTNTLESITWTADEGDEWTQYTYDLSSFDGEDIYIAFREYVADNYNDGAAVLLDLVQVGSPAAFDLALTDITTPSISESGVIDITGIVTCAGSTTAINSFDVTYSIDGGLESSVYSVNGLNLTTGQSYDFTHDVPYDFSAPGTYELMVTISNINGGEDDFADNNTLTKSINIVAALIQRKPLHEVFTASTCGFCPDANEAIDAVVLNPANFDNATLIKYQTSWPGAGDPYTTPEVSNRVSYYGITGVPAFFVDANSDSGTGYTQAKFNTYAAVPAFFEIEATHTFSGFDIEVDITITPYMNWEGKCRVAVVEKQTTGNVGSNGETEFNHVMMKMLPNPTGTTVDLTSGTPYNFQVSGNLASTFIEEIFDLEVVVFLQDDSNKDVMQSNYSELNVTDTDLILTNTEVTNNYTDCLLGTEEAVTIEIVNFGPNPVSDIEVSYTLNDGDPVVENFSGPIEPMSTENYTFTQTVDLSAVGVHEIVANISHEDDVLTSNNEASTVAVSGDAIINVAITFDNYPAETSWDMYDQDLDLVIASGSGYSGTSINEDVCILSDHCYTFTIYDAYGDGICCAYGSGSYTVSYEGIVVGTGGEFDDAESITDICNVGIDETSESLIHIYPNPANEQFSIITAEKSHISIYNISGQLVKSFDNISAQIDVSTKDMFDGTYIIKVVSENETVVKRVVVTK